MPIRLRAYTIVGGTLTYSLQDVIERDPLYDDVPSHATIQGNTVTVDIAALPPELAI